MLQQTRVAAVLEYYRRFLTHFPNLKVLAETPEEEVLASWSGLGYYRRARMLHAAAQAIVSNHSRRFPCRSSELLQLPGIGRYTAAAIASIAFREPISLVDGNVARVLSRIAQLPQAKHSDYRSIAQQLIDVDHPGDFNQAMMELGATVCSPRAPKCSLCPVRRHCQTRGGLSCAKSERRNKQQIAYCFSVARERILLEQRSPSQRLMPSMWELPVAVCPDKGRTLLRVRHAITNTDYEVVVLRARRPKVRSGQKWIPLKHLPQLPLTGLARKILGRLAVNLGHRTSQPRLSN